MWCDRKTDVDQWEVGNYRQCSAYERMPLCFTIMMFEMRFDVQVAEEEAAQLARREDSGPSGQMLPTLQENDEEDHSEAKVGHVHYW